MNSISSTPHSSTEISPFRKAVHHLLSGFFYSHKATYGVGSVSGAIGMALVTSISNTTLAPLVLIGAGIGAGISYLSKMFVAMPLAMFNVKELSADVAQMPTAKKWSGAGVAIAGIFSAAVSGFGVAGFAQMSQNSIEQERLIDAARNAHTVIVTNPECRLTKVYTPATEGRVLYEAAADCRFAPAVGPAVPVAPQPR